MFKKAQRIQSKLKIGISGPSGSGKTYSALRLASGIGKKIAVLDSERGSASLYSDRFDFDVVEITPPFTPQKYVDVMRAAYQQGYDVLIIDSVSHAWAGEGGLLNQKEQLDARGGNSFANWAKMTPKQEKFVSAIVQCPIHIICTMRSKQDYSQTNEGGKVKIQKVGLAPVQREGFEYELTTVFDVAMNHEAETSKDRTGLFVDKIATITEDTGKAFMQWLNAGVKLEPKTSPERSSLILPEELKNCGKEKEQSHIVNIDEPLFDESEPLPEDGGGLFSQKEIAEINKETSAKLPNKALGVYMIKGGKYNGKALQDIKDNELYRYITECTVYAKENNKPLPSEIQETLFYIKKYLGLND